MPTARVPYARSARLHLSKADPIMARIVAEVGTLGIIPRIERFQALVRAIIFQQLAGAAANAILQPLRRIISRPRFPFARGCAR